MINLGMSDFGNVRPGPGKDGAFETPAVDRIGRIGGDSRVGRGLCLYGAE